MAPVVGQRLPRPDAPDKVTGAALYVEDLDFAGSLVARVLRSPHSHARIARLDVSRARAHPGVAAVLTAASYGPDAVHHRWESLFTSLHEQRHGTAAAKGTHA